MLATPERQKPSVEPGAPTILVVDDSRINLNGVSRMLEGHFNVLTPESGPVASFPFGKRCFADGFFATEAEKAVTAVGAGVLREDIAVTLFKEEDASGILTPVVDAVAVTTYAEIKRIARDEVAT